jgi:hypothetical protein
MIVSTAGAESPNVHVNFDLATPKDTTMFWRVADFEESRLSTGTQFRIDEARRNWRCSDP